MTDTALASDTDSVTVADAAAAIADIAAALKARRAVPYLGPGAFALLPPDDCPIPRNSAELTQRLNAKVTAPGYTKVTSPAGAVTEVPEGILEALLDSGYTKSK